MIKKITFIFTMACLVLSFGNAFAQQAPVVYLDKSGIRTPDVDDTFTLPIKAQDYAGLYTYELLINFDADYLMATDIIGNEGGIEPVKEIDNENGTIRYYYCINDKPLSGNTLASITFKVIEIGIPEVSISRSSVFLSKPGKDDKTGDYEMEVTLNSTGQYASETEFEVGIVKVPKFVYPRTVFPYTLTVSFEEPSDGADIYYTMSTSGKPDKKYDHDYPFELSNTTTIYAFAEKNGIRSKTVQQQFTRNMSGVSGGGGGGGGGTFIPPPVVEQPQQPEVKKYVDIENHWSKDYFEKLAEKGIINGYEDGTIRPDRQITRAEAAKIIALAANLSPLDEVNLEFADLGEIADWAQGYVKAVFKEGIITGYEDNTFRPNQNITRSELVVIASRAFSLSQGNADEITFADKSDIPDWSLQGVAAAVAQGIMSGYDDNTFKPYNHITRAEVSKIIYNCMEL
ncbi:MAG: S-layer homology domain-containing protein [Firmicutes bacterium]|nr:S-layer homology domain-containing protein [Bacillota bacterium]